MTISLGLLFLGIFWSESHFLDIVFSIFETISHIVVDFVDLDIQYCCYFGLKAVLNWFLNLKLQYFMYISRFRDAV